MPTGWRAGGGEFDAKANGGTGALKIARKHGADDPRWLSDAFAVSPGDYECSALVKAENMYSPDNSFNANLRIAIFDSSGRVLERKELLYVLGTSQGWQRISNTFRTPQKAAKATLAFSFNKTTGTAWLGELRMALVRPAKRSPVSFGKGGFAPQTCRDFNLFYPGDNVWFMTWCNAPPATTVQCRITDYKLRTVKTVDASLNGAAVGYFLTTPPLQDGLQLGRYYVCHFDFFRDGKRTHTESQPFAILPEPTFPDGDPKRGRFGTIIEWPADTTLAHRLGCGWVRCQFGRSSGGVYNAKTFGMAVISNISIPGEFRAVVPKEQSRGVTRVKYRLGDDAAGFGKWVAEHVRKYGKWVDVWQLGNEPGHTAQQIADYAAFHKAAYRGIQTADPDAKIMMGGLTGLGWAGPGVKDWSLNPITKFIDDYKLHTMCDLYDYHFYQPWIAVAELLPGLIRDYKSRGAAKPLWCTEANNRCFGEYEPKRAADMIKRIVVLRAAGIEKILWFIVRESRVRGFSLMHPDGTPKITAVTFYHTIRTLDEATQVTKLDAGDNVWAYECSGGGKRAYVCWLAVPAERDMSPPGGQAAIKTQVDWEQFLGEAGSKTVKLRVRSKRVVITQIDGAQDTLDCHGTLTLEATPEPVIVVIRD